MKKLLQIYFVFIPFKLLFRFFCFSYGKIRSVIHYLSMIFSYQFLVNCVSSSRVNRFAYDKSVSIYNTTFSCKMLVLDTDMEFVFLGFLGPEFPFQIFSVSINYELVGIICVVSKSVIFIIIKNTCP